jgi:hypothetical protein
LGVAKQTSTLKQQPPEESFVPAQPKANNEEGTLFPAVTFRIPTTWHVRGRIEDVADILSEPEDFPRWWGEVYLSVTTTNKGDAQSIGQTVAVHSKGWLPYRLNWEGKLVENHRPTSWTVEATGDLVGRGVWTLRQRGDIAEINYDWSVSSNRLLFRVLAPMLRWVMVSNHRWAMTKGEKGLQAELVRRGAS